MPAVGGVWGSLWGEGSLQLNANLLPSPVCVCVCVWFSVTQVNKLKREMVHLQQELQFKERGFQTLKK